MVIVSQGDVSDLHHLQGAVVLMPSESRMSVFFSHHPCKNLLAKLPTVYLTNTKVVWSFNCRPNPHLWVYEKKSIQNSVYKPFLSTPEHFKVTVVRRCNLHTYLFLKFWKVFERTILHNCSTTATGSRKKKRRKACNSKWVFIMRAAGMQPWVQGNSKNN